MQLLSKRLSYRLLTEYDRDILFELDQDPEVMKYITGGRITTQKQLDELIIPRMNSYSNEKKGWGIWGAFCKSPRAFIGWILVRPMDFFSEHRDDDDIELGWRFKRSSWGQGYATEAAKCVAKEVFTRNDNRFFSAVADPENVGSIAIMKKLGMTFVKPDVYHTPLGDIDVVVYRVAASCLDHGMTDKEGQ